MFIAETSHGGKLRYSAHPTAQAAVQWLLADLGPDLTKKDFWASDCGTRILHSGKQWDFSVLVHESAHAAISEIARLGDDDSYAFELRALADAIEAGVKANY